jgi:hypothetical protein
MQKVMLVLLVAIIALAPAFAAAQTSPSGSDPKSGSSPSSPPSSSGSGTTTSPGATGGSSSGSPSSPSASPSGASDFSKITSKADCDRVGGMWLASLNKCEKK